MTRPFVLDIGWIALADSIGVRPADILRQADLPEDLFQRERPTLESPAFLRLWAVLTNAMESETPGLDLGRAISPEVFSPPIFAASCSPNLAVAVERLQRFKPLVGPLILEPHNMRGGLELTFDALEGVALPDEYIATELVFLVHFARTATRHDIRPIAVEMVNPPTHPAYADYFHCAVRAGPFNRVVFSPADTMRPFLSANPAMFSMFEPALQTRLDALEKDATMADRVRAALMEAMPAGQADVKQVSKKLGVSTRGLQRKLTEQGTSFQIELKRLRERLARDYLLKANHTNAEIAYLLGFEDPNSFIRAFSSWTGKSPEAMRKVLRQVG
ncbi:MAG: helix-turn-helix domain-containing protein [Boseongicola sp.]|nr:helix-turn-helix domain-containing protein [Boseongicola sp.]